MEKIISILGSTGSIGTQSLTVCKKMGYRVKAITAHSNWKLMEEQIRQFNPVKDATDTQIAIELAMELGSRKITLVGGTGTRLDHVLGNIQTLYLPFAKGIDCRISRNHCAGRDELFGHPIEWKVCCDGGGERSADTHDRSEGGNCFCDIFVKEVSQHRQNDTCKQTDWGKHAAHSFCMVLGIGIIQEVCKEWAGFWVSDGVFFHRKSFGDVAQQVSVL